MKCKLCHTEIPHEGYCLECERIYADDSPCLRCLDRHEGCHGKCPHYILWKAVYDSKRDRIIREAQADNAHSTALKRIKFQKMLNKFRGITKKKKGR